MKRIAIAAALVVSAAAFSAALADSDPPRDGSSSAPSERRSMASQEGGEARPRDMAEGFFDHFRDGEHHRHHRHHHWDDDEDDDDGSASADRGGANQPADPNAAAKPVPDSGVFNGKARPKVEVQ